MKKGDAKKIAIGAAVAGAVGYVAGILTAPKSGKETRKDVKNAAIKAKTKAEKELKKLHSELSHLLDKAKRNALSAKNLADKDFNRAVEAAAKAKEKVREVLSSIHEGGSDDKDLQKAIDDATAAIDHLKSFIKKNGK
jgi:gas vesicle protein